MEEVIRNDNKLDAWINRFKWWFLIGLVGTLFLTISIGFTFTVATLHQQYQTNVLLEEVIKLNKQVRKLNGTLARLHPDAMMKKVIKRREVPSQPLEFTPTWIKKYATNHGYFNDSRLRVKGGYEEGATLRTRPIDVRHSRDL